MDEQTKKRGKYRPEKRVAVMISPETHFWLWEEVGRLCNAHERGECQVQAYDPDVKNPAHPKVSLERFICLMLDARQRHRERRRAARLRERNRRRARAALAPKGEGVERG